MKNSATYSSLLLWSFMGLHLFIHSYDKKEFREKKYNTYCDKCKYRIHPIKRKAPNEGRLTTTQK